MIILDYYHVDIFGELSEITRVWRGKGVGKVDAFSFFFLLTAQVQWLDIFVAD